MIPDSTSTIGLYTKAIGTLVVTGLTSYIAAVSDGSVDTSEWITIIIAVLVSTTVVWAVPSTPRSVRVYGKTIAAALVAFFSSVAVGLNDGGGLSQAEWITAVVALLGAAGFVGASSNAASSDPVDPVSKKIVPVSVTQKEHLTHVFTQPGYSPETN